MYVRLRNRNPAPLARGQAARDYQRAINLSSEFAFAQVNYATALYEIGDTKTALRELRTILR